MIWPLSAIARRRRQNDAKLLELAGKEGELTALKVHELLGWSLGKFYVVSERLERRGDLLSRWGPATPERGWRRVRLYRPNKSATVQHQ